MVREIAVFARYHRPMDANTYEHLVFRLEGASKDDPAAFRFKVLLISSLAYVVLFLVLLGLAWAVYLLYQVAMTQHHGYSLFKVGLLVLTLLPLFGVTLSTFLTRLPPPEGRELSRAEAPRVFELIDKIQRKLKGPKIDHVLIDERYNAAICQVPRLGLFGWHRNYLIIGLPYLLGTPTREAIATLAHEYGHLTGEHGKTGSWIYRQRLTFGAIRDKLASSAEGNWINDLMAAALDRFAPYYNAYTFVLSRQQEYEADATASRIAGEAVNASGLVRDTLLGRWIENIFWPRLYAQADEVEVPRFMPFTAMRTAIGLSYEDWAKPEHLRAALKDESGLLDTHPCLRERLEAMDCKASLPPPLEHSAGESLLGASLRTLIDEFDERWWQAHRADWQRHFRRHTEERQRLAALATRDIAGMTSEELYELAQLQYRHADRQAALFSVSQLLERQDAPAARASLLKGKIMLRLGDRQGLDWLVQAMHAEPGLSDEALRAGYTFLQRAFSQAAAEEWLAQQTGEFA